MSIEKIAAGIARTWANNGTIEVSLIDVYRYGIEISLSSALGMCLVVFTGFLFFHFLDAIFFLLTFIPIRIYCGGYHADSYLVCNISMLCTFSLTALCAAHIEVSFHAILIIAMIGAIIIAVCCPVENKYKPLDDKQKKKCKIISLALFGAMMAACIVLYHLRIDIYRIILFTIIAVISLAPIGMIKNKREEKHL